MAQTVASLLVKLSADNAELRSSLRAVKKDLRGLGRRAETTGNKVKYAFNKIRRAAQVVASAFIFVAGIRQLGNLVAAMATAEDRVKLLNARFQQFARAPDAFTRVYALSKELGVSLDEAAGGMTRLLVATKSMGTAQSVLEDVYKNIVILGRAGGTSTEEMIGGMRQLSQGLASGRLAGEELRSVLENLPLVAMEIADQMGIGIGQIRKAAAEGKISGEVVIAAMSEIEIAMEDLPKTWAMQTENLRTEWGLFLNDLSKEVDEAGLLKSLVDAVQWVRFGVLHSEVGISTDDLMARMAVIKTQLGVLEQKRAAATDEWRIKPNTANMGRAGQEWIAGMPDTGGLTAARQIAELTAEYKRLNDAVDSRNARDALLDRAEAAKAFAKSIKESSRSLKEFNIIDPDERMREVWGRINDHLEKVADTVKDKLGGAFKKFVDDVRTAQTVIGRGISLEEWQAYRRMLKDELIPELENVNDVTDEMSEYSKRAAQKMQDAFADFLFDPFADGIKGMLEGFLTAIRRMIAETAAANIFNDTSQGIGKWVNSLFGKRAAGGPVGAGGTYLVGERGPELLTMGASSGMITPNHQLTSGGGSTTIYNIEAGADIATIMSVVIPALERTKNAAVGEVISRKREGRL